MLFAVRRRHSSTASPIELPLIGGELDADANPICARYHDICSGVSSLGWASAGLTAGLAAYGIGRLVNERRAAAAGEGP